MAFAISVEERLRWSVPVALDVFSGSMAGNLSSGWIRSNKRTTAHRLKWTGTPTGTFTVDLSMDGITVDATLTASELSPTLTVPAGSASSVAFEVVSACPFRRVNYVRTSGTGTLTGFSSEETET